MNMSTEVQGNTQAMRRTGWILSGIVIAFMVIDAGVTLLAIEPIKKATLEIGYPLDLMWLIGVLQLTCLVLYAIPATCVFGAVILTGFLGGAISSHLRVAGTLTPEMVVSLILGVLAWGGLWFRDPRLRVLIPRRRDAVPVSALPNVPGAT
jgi:DoxX-like family